VLIILALIALAALALVPLLWREFHQLFRWISREEEYVHKSAVDDLARVMFFKIGCWFVVTVVVEIIAVIWLVWTSGVECARCRRSLLFPGRWDLAERQGTCPCCQAPIADLFPAGAHHIARDRLERLRILKRNHRLLTIGVFCWSIVLAWSLIGLVRHDDWALILVCANAVVLTVNCVVMQFTKRQIRRLADVDPAGS
jgi:hypothetical protein